MLYERDSTKAVQRYKRAISLSSIGAWYLSSLRERQMFWQSTKLILNIKHRQWFRRPADFLPGPPPPLSPFPHNCIQRHVQFHRSMKLFYLQKELSFILCYKQRFKSRQFGERRGQAHELSVVWLRQSVFCHHWGLLLPGGRGLFNFLDLLLIIMIALFKVIVVFKQVGNKFGTREPQAKSRAYKWR